MLKAEAEEIDWNEGLPNFFASIPGHLQKQWYTQELYDRKVLGIKNLSNSQFDRLRTTKRACGGRTLAAGYCYDLLTMEKYQLGF